MRDLCCHIYVLLGKGPELRQVNSDLRGKASVGRLHSTSLSFWCKNPGPGPRPRRPPLCSAEGCCEVARPRCPVGAAPRLWAPQTSVGTCLFSCTLNTPRGSPRCQPGCPRPPGRPSALGLLGAPAVRWCGPRVATPTLFPVSHAIFRV